MATYKYQQNFFDGASYGYVKYNITPDFGTYVAPDETITITGQMYNNVNKTRCIEVGTYVNGASRITYINKTVNKGSVATFTMTFQMWELGTQWGADREKEAPIVFTFWSGADQSGEGDATMPVATQKIAYISYRINPKIITAEFERYMLVNNTYAPNDEGTSVMGTLKLSLADGLTEDDITIAFVEITDDADNTDLVSINSTVLETALSDSGYTESVPGIFNNLTFNTANNYTLLITVGDDYDTATASILIARAFANVHLSGAQNGGVAFGKFSSSTDNLPLFECVYQAQFSGIVQFVTNVAKKSICDAIYPVGSIMFRMDTTDPATFFPGTTWTRIKDKFLFGASDSSPYNTIGNTGGNKSVSLPNHTHSIVGNSVYYANSASSSANNRLLQTTTGPSSASIATMPPYEVVYIWQRTA